MDVRDLFKLRENGTSVSKEALAGVTTFFAMAYMFVVTPNIMSATGMPWGAVFIASILASAAGTLVMALYANVPFVLGAGPSMAAFFSVTACSSLGFTWQQAMSVVFICGVVGFLIAATDLRKKILNAVPKSLQVAICGGIGMFVAYMGLIHCGLIDLSGDTPALSTSLTPSMVVFIVGLLSAVVFSLRKWRAGIIISLVIASVTAFLLGITELGDAVRVTEAFAELPETVGVVFTSEGLPSLFSDPSTLLNAVVLIMLFVFVDVFDSVGTFLGAGRQSGIFTEDEMEGRCQSGEKTRLDRALIADSVGTLSGSVLGTCNTTTLVESTTGISAGARTGLASVFSAACMLVCMIFTPIFSLVPTEAISGILVMVGIMMMSTFAEIEWSELKEAIPAFFASVFMVLCFNISYGIAAGFVAYCVVKIATGKYREINPIIAGFSVFFIISMLLMSQI